VREHGGQTWVEDSALGGASFVLELAAVADRVEVSELAAAAATTVPNARPSPRRVLLVDDEESIRATAQRILRRHGHDVDGAADGVAALLLLEAMEYDIVPRPADAKT
jgi:PleD family two-component response regulator